MISAYWKRSLRSGQVLLYDSPVHSPHQDQTMNPLSADECDSTIQITDRLKADSQKLKKHFTTETQRAQRKRFILICAVGA